MASARAKLYTAWMQWRIVAVIGLLVLCAAVYSPVRRHEFVNYDDDKYVTSNAIVQKGLSVEGIKWGFTTGHFGNWHPLTWLSLMIDRQIYGERPSGFHLTNLVLHALGVVALFLFLELTLASAGLAFTIAAVYAVHPLHIESVAWIAERKGILSTCFGLIALYAYARWHKTESAIWPALFYVAFLLSLLSKQMLVTLPVLLCVIDYWPLRRPITKETLLEKFPMLMVAFAFAILAFVFQNWEGALASVDEMTAGQRLCSTIDNTAEYLARAFVPTKLAVFYPLDVSSLSTSRGTVLGIVLVGVSIVAIALRRSLPSLFTGWFWFLIALAPVSGIVQIGSHAGADRYTDIPLIGIYMAVIVLVDQWLNRAGKLRLLRPVLGFACIVTLMAMSTRQVAVWKDSVALFEHATFVTEGNYVAHVNLGFAYRDVGRNQDAVEQFRTATRLRPNIAQNWCSLGTGLALVNDLSGAESAFKQALSLNPNYADAAFNLGTLYWTLGRVDEARRYLQEALRLAPEDATYQAAIADFDRSSK